MKTEKIIYADPRDVTFLVRRDRDPEGFALVKESVRKIGVVQIIKAKKIGPRKWLANFGQGRCEALIELYNETKDKRFLRVPIEPVQDISPGAFLSENLLRRQLTWQQQAKLIKQDVDALPQPLSQMDLLDIAKRWFITVAHLGKLLRILDRLSPKLEKELKQMTLREAELLTSLPPAGQEIVMQTLAEEGLEKTPANVASVVKKAKEQHLATGQWSKSMLRASLKRVGEDLARVRTSLKPIRLHWSLGPQNLEAILTEKKYAPIKAAIKKAKINTEKFIEAMKP